MIFEALFNKDLDKSEIINALSKVFSLSSQKIFITDNVYSIDVELDENIEVLCEKIDLKGDFSKRISIYLRSKKLEKLNYLEEEVFSQLCTMTNSECLISDNSKNPYKMILLKAQSRRKVSLVPKDLEKEIYTIENDSAIADL